MIRAWYTATQPWQWAGDMLAYCMAWAGHWPTLSVGLANGRSDASNRNKTKSAARPEVNTGRGQDVQNARMDTRRPGKIVQPVHHMNVQLHSNLEGAQ